VRKILVIAVAGKYGWTLKGKVTLCDIESSIATRREGHPGQPEDTERLQEGIQTMEPIFSRAGKTPS